MRSIERLAVVAVLYSVRVGAKRDECSDASHLPEWAAAAGKPWLDWEACDTYAAYEAVCDPQPPVCHTKYLCETRQVRND